MKRRQFEFLNDPSFAVLSETVGSQQLFPHTGQLAKLWRAINRDFLLPLPNKIRRADHRAKDSMKILRRFAAASYCGLFNTAREDRIQLHPLPDMDLVTQVTIVQQFTTKGSGGDVHHFRFYGGTEFFPEIRLNGKRIQITSHVLDRFEKRFPGDARAGLTNLLIVLFAHPWMTALINNSSVMVTPYEDTIFAFPFDETATEFLLKTCLTVNEIHSFMPGPPTNVYNHHYAKHFSPPVARHWDPEKELERCRQLWVHRTPMRPDVPPLDKNETWLDLASKFTFTPEQLDFDQNTSCVFKDDIAGPVLHFHTPNQSQSPELKEAQCGGTTTTGLFSDASRQPGFGASWSRGQ